MRSKATQFHSGLLHPRTWLTWLGFGLWFLITQLPYPLLLMIGKGLGLALYSIGSQRKLIAMRNLEVCFPELSLEERQTLLRQNFMSLGIATMEIGMAWWWPKKRFKKLLHFEGLEYLDKVKGRGVLALGIHYTTLEIGATALSTVLEMDGMYRAHKNPVYDFLQARGRINKSMTESSVVYERKDVRGVMKALKQGRALWYGPDQDYGTRQGVYAPFFGTQAATVYATARFAEKTGAAVMPFTHIRLPGSTGYKITIYPPLEDFPTGDDVADATRINRIVEENIKLQPEQYLWVHKRFKNRPEGEVDIYNLPPKKKKKLNS